MELLVRAFPVLPGKETELRQFAQDLQGSRADEAAEFYASLGIAHESWYAQEHRDGVWVIVITEFATRKMTAAATDYAQSQAAFARWFKEQVLSVTGVDPQTTPLGPPTEGIFHLHGAPGVAGLSLG